MAGLIKLPHILGFKFILPRLLGPVCGLLDMEIHCFGGFFLERQAVRSDCLELDFKAISYLVFFLNVVINLDSLVKGAHHCSEKKMLMESLTFGTRMPM